MIARRLQQQAQNHVPGYGHVQGKESPFFLMPLLKIKENFPQAPRGPHLTSRWSELCYTSWLPSVTDRGNGVAFKSWGQPEHSAKEHDCGEEVDTLTKLEFPLSRSRGEWLWHRQPTVSATSGHESRVRCPLHDQSPCSWHSQWLFTPLLLTLIDLSVRVSSFLLVDISGSPILPIALNFLKKFFNMKNFKHTLKEIIFNRTPSAYFMINNILPFLPHVILLKYFQANTRHHDA